MINRIKVGLKAIGLFLWNYKFTILCLAFFYITCRSLYSNHNNQYILLTLSFFFLLNALSKTSKVLKWIFTIIFAFLISIDTYFAYVLGESLSFGVLDAILNTNSLEAYGVMSQVLFLGIPMLIGIVLLFYLTQRELKNIGMGKKLSYCIFAAYWVLFLPIYSVAQIYTRDTKTIKMFESNPTYMIFIKVGGKIPLVYRNVLVFLAYNEQMTDIRKYRSKERIMPDHLIFNEDVASPLKIYLVIGESAISSHLSLYGYDIQTTPFLDSIALVNPELKHYSAISSAPLTAMAIPMAFTFATPLDQKPMYEQKNLLEISKKIGYETLWISSQALLGVGDSDVSVFSSVSDSYYHLGIYPFDDIQLVDVVRRQLKDDQKQLFALQLEGSHIDYASRFDQVDEEAIKGTGSITDYDRTIHHTDRLFRELYTLINEDGSPYVLIYFSDHGEIIGKGHGLMNEGIQQFEIPFITMQSGGYPVDSLIQKYTNREIGLINNTSVMNIILELIGYQFRDESIHEVTEASKYVRHADYNTYLYEELKKAE